MEHSSLSQNDRNHGIHLQSNLKRQPQPIIDSDTIAILKIQTLSKLHSVSNMYEQNVPTAGGIQQYLNKHREHCCNNKFDDGLSSDGFTNDSAFNALPAYVKLEILSYVSTRDLCRLATVSREWLSLTSDTVLWQKHLIRDSRTWSMVGWNSNPLLYAQLNSEWTPKQIYLQCCPEIRDYKSHDNYLFTSLSILLRSLFHKVTPRVAMFGPGLESSTSGIVRRILYDESELFTKVRMFPGLFGGLGSGFTLKMSAGKLDLMVLYSSSKRERTQHQAHDRMQRSRLIKRVDAGDDVEQGRSRGYVLTQALSDLCHTLDAFVYVVDADTSEGSCCGDELMAMCNERWSVVRLPVLVMSCVRDASKTRRPCIDVVTALDMSALNRPWQVHDVDVSSMSGVEKAFHWLIEQAQGR